MTRYVLIGFGWFPILFLAAWWAGFMPFPTRPAEIGENTEALTGIGGEHFKRILSANKAREESKVSPYSIGQWWCDKDNKEYCHLYQITDQPFYGWTGTHWVLKIVEANSGEFPIALYETYAACKWNQERKQEKYDDTRVTYERWATEHHQPVQSGDYEIYSCQKMP